MVPEIEKEVDPDHFHYFGFGSNLLDERLHYGIKDATYVGVGVLKDYKLGFGGFTNRWKGAGATIFKTLDEEVWGVVWKVAHSFSEALDAQEAAYHRLHEPIEMTTGEVISCRTYQMTDVTSGNHLPSPHYKHVIVCGA
uniref:gamma-glutamylcyclotransferase n=1 Tax=Plectus sambesii TaxID=2011161 RepID=A0A914V1G9_9BILA